MSLFDKIKDKLGLGGVSNEAHKPVDPNNTPNQHATDTVIDSERPTAAHNATTTPPGAAPSNEAGPTTAAVDVPAKLDAMAANHPEKLNWRTSIVDLLKLLDMDSSLAARTELAEELNVNAGPHGSAEQNIALSKAVWRKLEENGGLVPDSLRD